MAIRRVDTAPRAPKPRHSSRARFGDRRRVFSRSAFDNAPIGMALTAIDGRFLAVNRALCELTGRRPRPPGDQLQQITHPDDVLAHRARRTPDATGDETGHETEKRYLRP